MIVNDKESAVIAMNDMFYYAMNIQYDQITYENYRCESVTEWVPEFIKNVTWGCDVQHMIEKWNFAMEAGTYGQFFKFYAGLDNLNRRRLNEYIIDTYDSGSNI